MINQHLNILKTGTNFKYLETLSHPDFLEFSFILMKKEVHMSNQLLNKYAEIISSLKASNGIKVVSVEEIQDNEVFLRLKDSFESYFSEISETRLPLLILMDKIFTAVEMKGGYKLKITANRIFPKGEIH